MVKRSEQADGVYGCYRCGAINGSVTEVSDDKGILCVICGECGEENTIVTFGVAMDMINEFHFHSRMRGGISYERNVDNIDAFIDTIKEGLIEKE